ncbi:MAG TPA: SDR family oxidoreductase [Acidimicrobiales bacterium]|nr:SDR family oxidoreductase [Acidimicrobiales bacterium]
MDLGLAGRTVLVTGGAGGIGAAVVKAFAAEGGRVAVHYNSSASEAGVLANEVGGIALQADLRDEKQADGLIPACVKALGGLDVVVANAGVWPKEDVPVSELSLDRWRATLDANLTATFLTARAWARHVGTAKSGALVMVSSTAGVFGEAGHSDYASAKSAISSGLLLSLKNEITRVAPLARVNAVAPGWTVTPMTEGRLDPDDVARVTATMPLKKVARAEDIAAAVLFLSSDCAAGHITGQVLTVAGGMEGRLLHPL